jgi:DNA invertase Pin-like site-specific DNA recombinase
MRVALYGRVSTKDKGQDVENQFRQLREFCQRQGWGIVAEFYDKKTGTTDRRPKFQEMLTAASQKRFDLVLFWSLDRFSREGTLATLKHLERLDGCGVAWRSFTEPYLDSLGLFKDVILALLATLAKQETVRRSERQLAAYAKLRATGKMDHIGRKRKIFDRDRVRRLHAEGHSLAAIRDILAAQKVNVSRATVHRVVTAAG